MNALQEAIKRVRPIELEKRDTEEFKEALLRGRTMSGRMFGIERDAREKVRRELIELEARQRLADYFSKHPRLQFDMDALQWRDKNRLPKLVVFALDEPLFFISVSRGSFTVTPRSLPIVIQNRYDDVVRLLERRSRRSKRSFFISAKFSGIIPEDAREKIFEAQKHFDRVFIIAEPVGMVIGRAAPLPRDPLVVGWDGVDMWYICEFDTTPIEEAALLVGPANPSSKKKI